MLIQTDKFGTSVAQSLRVYSETLRTKRRQRAEEAAAKTGVKMVFPLVFCIFPAIWVVTIGPAAIKFVTVLFPLIEKQQVAIADEHEDRRWHSLRRTSIRARSSPTTWPSPSRARPGPSGCCRAAASNPGEALWIVPSRGVHTWGMRFAIDVVALDERGVVIDQVSRAEAVAHPAAASAAPPACWSCRRGRSTRPAPRSAIASCFAREKGQEL